MIHANPSFSVKVDITNPGQFFACCGLLELAHRLWLGSEGWFGNQAFHLLTAEPEGAVKVIIDKICEAKVSAELHQVEILGSNGKSVKDPKKILPLSVVIEEHVRIRLSWWLDEQRRRQSPFKMWSAHGTSHRIFSSLLKETRKLLSMIEYADPFASTTESSTRFGIDPVAGWKTLDVGFSPNEQNMKTMSSPVTELLAAIGLQRFRPSAEDGNKRSFFYSVWRRPLSPAVAAAVTAGCIGTGTTDRYMFQIASRGKFKTFTTAIPC